jgi:protein phosphatase
VIFGGAIASGGLAPDTLNLLDLSGGEDSCKWIALPSSGNSPGKRYGHTMCYLKPYLVVFGGNVGNKITNDLWLINIDDGILEWKKLEPTGDNPGNRMYHSSSVCRFGGAAGMMIIFGGRSDQGYALNDTWGLRKHRNGTWDWVKAPYASNYTPLKRFQHSISFFYNFMIILGGRTDEDHKSIPIEIYDTETSEWTELANFNKFRHSSWIVDNLLFTHGGFDYLTPMVSKNDLVMIDIIKLLNTSNALSKRLEKVLDSVKKVNLNNSPNSSSGNSYSGSQTSSKNNTPTISPNSSILNATGNLGINNVGAQNSMSNSEIQLNLSSRTMNKDNFNNTLTGGGNYNNYNYSNNLNLNNYTAGPGYYNLKSKNQKEFLNKNGSKSDRPLIIKEGEISILSSGRNEDKLVIKRVTFDEKGKYRLTQESGEEPLHEKFLKELLNPMEWLKKNDQDMERFKFRTEQIVDLTRQCIDVVASQPMVLRINTPVKVFGDIHGQYLDLMTFFARWGEPKEGPNGDIHIIDYLFLGDYVDRGNMSLETMCLLMALKVKYPDRIHLLRGNHEDKLINSGFGFYEECQIRLNEDPMQDDSAFTVINDFFEYLPLAAVIEDQILCLHGGIGANVKRISDIECIERPLEVVHEASNKTQQIVMDILWSDPTDTDEELGIQPNVQRDSNNYGNIVKFGPDVVKNFLQNNNLSYIIRAHECVLDGFERFAGGALITLFSATDYCRRHNNAGALIVIKNNFEMVPHLIYPPDGGNKHWIDDEDSYKKRPPTPPRVRYNKNY